MAKQRMSMTSPELVVTMDDVQKALCGVREIIDLEGYDEYDESALHPGAVLVTFNGLAQSVAVVDESDEVDLEQAIEAAEEYMRGRGYVRSGQEHSYAFVLEEKDAPGYVSEERAEEISTEIERYLGEHANQDAAAASSTLDDQDLLDLEEDGYDPEEAVKIAEFDYEMAVDGDILFNWHDTLGIARSDKVETWRDADRAGVELFRWMREHGYERVERLGGSVPVGEEIEIDTDHLIEHVAEESQSTKKQVETVLEERYHASAGGQIYWNSASGEVQLWAKLKPRVYLVIEYVRTDSDDYGSRHAAIVSAETKSEAEEAFAEAVESGDETFWSREALDSGDTPERMEGRNAPLERQGWYMSWTDYESALSAEELEEAQETDEWPDIESSSEVIQVQSVRVLDDPDSAQASAEHLDVVWEHDVED